MANRILVHQHGGAEVLQYEAYDLPAPGWAKPWYVTRRSVSISSTSISYRPLSGAVAAHPPGMEGAGVVEAVGAGVTDVWPGQRVAYAGAPIGAYADIRVMPAEKLVPLPDEISAETAAAMMLKGMTAQYLLRQTYAVQPGDTILFHAAAGGVGLIVGQWAKHLGATAIGTVGSAEKAELARAHGYQHVIDYRREDFVARVKEITGGKGVAVVYDGVGKDTFVPSLDCLQPRGLAVNFGNASGPVENLKPADAQRQRLALCDPTDADDLHSQSRVAVGLCQGPVRRRDGRRRQYRNQPALRPGRCRRGASCAGGPRHHRLDPC